MRTVLITVFILGLCPAAFFAQSKRNSKTKVKTTAATAATPQPTPAPTPEPAKTPAPKRNERPDNGNGKTKANTRAQPPTYFYEFNRPGFTYPSVFIEHDEAGRGQITFVKAGNDIAICDPIELSPITLKNIQDAFAALSFLESTETYQTERDHSNMGNVTITLKRDGRQRTAKYNWTENKNAKALADEYRRISNEYIWRFEITSARENQPLLAPQLMKTLDDYIRRNEISDPANLVPFLTALSNDERIPLIARDKAGKLIEQLQKAKK